jgi:import inner membrane translocase subunit TIM8
MDPALQRFIQIETEKQKLQGVIHQLNEKCWDQCMDGVKPSTKLEGRSQDCIRNCVERFLDSNIMITRRMGEKASAIGNSEYS